MMAPTMRESFDPTPDSGTTEELSRMSLGIEWGRFLLLSGALLGFIYLSLSPTFRTGPTYFELTILWFGYFSTLGLIVLNVIQVVRRIKARGIKRNSQRA
jgi:hypothetical protein